MSDKDKDKNKKSEKTTRSSVTKLDESDLDQIEGGADARQVSGFNDLKKPTRPKVGDTKLGYLEIDAKGKKGP